MLNFTPSRGKSETITPQSIEGMPRMLLFLKVMSFCSASLSRMAIAWAFVRARAGTSAYSVTGSPASATVPSVPKRRGKRFHCGIQKMRAKGFQESDIDLP